MLWTSDLEINTQYVKEDPVIWCLIKNAVTDLKKSIKLSNLL